MMANELLFFGRCMGLKTYACMLYIVINSVFTDHSLSGFADAGSININKVLKFSLSDVDHVITVSHTGYVEQ